MYTIVDLETTGFAPSRGDKIVEVAAVQIDENHNVINQYNTLINPKRDISNSHIHGIEPFLVKNAPSISDVAPFLKTFLQGSTIVAHNASFDLRFLNAELLNNNYNAHGLCTLKLSRTVEPDLPNRKLITLCHYFDIDPGASHEAFSDAVATAKLFSILRDSYLSQYSLNHFRDAFDSPLDNIQLAKNNPTKIEYRRSDAKKDHQKEKQKINILINRLPTESISDNDENKQEYLDLLGEALADRIISDYEIEALNTLSQNYGFSRKDVQKVHKDYLRQVIQIYLIDDVISEFERNDLEKLSELLGINNNELNDLISSEKEKTSDILKDESTITLEDKAVCFTGKLQSKINGEQVKRSKAQKLAQQRGMIIKKSVTKKLDYLVAAKPSTMSGKAKKARKYDIPILAEPEFWKLIGINVE